jgi:hypothetical protein
LFCSLSYNNCERKKNPFVPVNNHTFGRIETCAQEWVRAIFYATLIPEKWYFLPSTNTRSTKFFQKRGSDPLSLSPQMKLACAFILTTSQRQHSLLLVVGTRDWEFVCFLFHTDHSLGQLHHLQRTQANRTHSLLIYTAART